MLHLMKLVKQTPSGHILIPCTCVASTCDRPPHNPNGECFRWPWALVSMKQDHLGNMKDASLCSRFFLKPIFLTLPLLEDVYLWLESGIYRRKKRRCDAVFAISQHPLPCLGMARQDTGLVVVVSSSSLPVPVIKPSHSGQWACCAWNCARSHFSHP